MDCFANKFLFLFLLLVVLNVVRSLFLFDYISPFFYCYFFKDSLISVKKMTFNSNMQYANFKISCFKDDNGAMLVNSSFQYVYDILKIKAIFSVKASNGNSTTYDNEIFKTSIDFCKFSDGVVGTFAMRWFMENFQEAANYEMKCPYSKVVT